MRARLISLALATSGLVLIWAEAASAGRRWL